MTTLSTTEISTAAGPAARRRSPIIRILFLGLLFEVWVLMGVLASPFVREWMPRPARSAEDPLTTMADWRMSISRSDRDPRLGARAPELKLFAEDRQSVQLGGLAGKKVALVFLKAGCGCSTDALANAWGTVHRKFPTSTVIMAFQKLDKAVEASARKIGGVRVVLDPGGKTAMRYNALWLPRAYTLDESGNVSYVQGAKTLDSQAPLVVERLWRGDS
jgi:hypothetical protein